MKFVIVSDLHIGAEICTLVKYDSAGKRFIKGEMFDSFLDAVGSGNDYLIVIGDLMDFAIESYDHVYGAMGAFLGFVQGENIAKEIIYLPGNHDFNIWHTIEHETNIINRLKGGKSPRKFRMSVPGIIDCRGRGKSRLTLHDVRREKKNYSGYGGLFLDSISRAFNKKGDRVIFNVAYPNLYLLLDEKTYILTHGHYFEQFWSFAGNFLPHIAKNDPDFGSRISNMDMVDLVSVNFPLCQLSSSGIGQAGILTDIARNIQSDIVSGKMSLTKTYLNRLAEYIDSKTNSRKWYSPVVEAIESIALKKAISLVIKKLSSSDETLHELLVKGDKEASIRLENYFRASLNELNGIDESVSKNLNVIFGHTHVPINFDSDQCPRMVFNGGEVKMFNTGGWVSEPSGNGTKKFCGAVVFRYDSRNGLTSQEVKSHS